jgi:hypothetical protein
MCYGQGDQIGRILAYWAIVFFGQSFENHRSSLNVLAIFSKASGYE